MGSGNDNAKGVAHRFALGMRVECTGAAMHGRRQHIGFQSQQQFTDLCIGTRSDIAQFLLKIIRSPGLQSPIFIINKNTAIFDGRSGGDIVGGNIEGILMTHRHISPPIPG